MELRIEQFQLPKKIEFNFAELKEELAAKVEKYNGLVYDDSQIKLAKSDVSNLRKLKKALNDERIRKEKEYMQPFNEFKAEINEVIQIIDQPIAMISRQIEDYDNQKKQQKLIEIREYFDSCERPEWLNFDQIFDERWLNASVSMKQVAVAIDERLDQIEIEMKTLKTLPEFSFEAIETYKHSLNINMAIAEGQRLAEIQKRKAEEVARRQQEAEEKAKQEAAVLHAAPTENDQSMEVQIEMPVREWISFKAYLSVEEARDRKSVV